MQARPEPKQKWLQKNRPMCISKGVVNTTGVRSILRLVHQNRKTKRDNARIYSRTHAVDMTVKHWNKELDD
jgi:hypothetical protein